jgi:hypothetical protein
MKRLSAILVACVSIASQAQNNFKYLDINNVKAGINSNGNLHYAAPGTGFHPEYEVPKGSGKHSSGGTNLWFGGMHNNQLHLSAGADAVSAWDFNSGPLSVDGNCLVTNSAKYKKVWKINKADINDFIANFANGNVQNGTYTPAPDLLSWPGNGDITKNEDFKLAPYLDKNGDNIYNPLVGGDYPLIKGDQALYFIYNDVSTSPYASGGANLGIEIRCMAYAYGTCSVVTANPVLDYTTFYDYTIINRSVNAYTDFYLSLYTGSCIGQYIDDYIGCDVKDNYGYAYNADADDETGGGANGYGANPPAAGFALLRSPEGTTDGIDNDGDGVTDEVGEQMGMTNFSYFLPPVAGVPIAMETPSISTQYYNYMRSIWIDGSPFTCNSADGYGGTISTPYAFPGTTYTNSACGPANWSETLAPGYKGFTISTKKASFQPAEIIRLEYAYVTSFPTSGSALTKLDQDVNAVKAFYQSGAGNSCVATGIEEQSGANAFALYPNPASSQITLTFEKALPADAMITISDVLGKALLTMHSGNQESVHIDLSAFASGIYFVKVSAEGKSSVKKIIKE